MAKRRISLYGAYTRSPDIILPKNLIKISRKGKRWDAYAWRPIEFAYEVLGIEYLTDDIKRVLLSICENRVTNVQASHGCGKSHVGGAVLVLWWVFAMGGLCITTAPTERQVKEILWAEAKASYNKNKSKFGGRSGELFIKVTEKNKAFGFTSRATSSDGFQGEHAEYLLVIIDESCGISQAIDEGAESCLVATDNRMMRIGNPLASGTPFAQACSKDHIRIAAWTHPNVAWAYRQDDDGIHRVKSELRPYLFDDNGEVLDRPNWGKPALRAMQAYLESIGAIEIKGAISVEWIERARRKYHEGSAFWEARVEARFPLDNAQSIIPRRLFLMARIRFDKFWEELTPEKQTEFIAKSRNRYGLDVGDGGDPHALSRWSGSILWSIKNQPTIGDEMDTARAAGLVIGEIKKHGNGSINVDNVGVGAGTLAMIKEQGYYAKGIRWGASAKDNERFFNLKAEQYWLMREELEFNEPMIAPLGEFEDQLIEDWAQTFYEETSKGQIRIEPKKRTIERLGRSTDCGDSAILGFHAKSTMRELLLPVAESSNPVV
jgi:hypothetical protein